MNLSFSIKCSTLLCKITSKFFAFKNNRDYSLLYSIDSYRFCAANEVSENVEALSSCSLSTELFTTHFYSPATSEFCDLTRAQWFRFDCICMRRNYQSPNGKERRFICILLLAGKLKRYVTWSHNECKKEWHIIILNICQKCRKYIFALLMLRFREASFRYVGKF